MSRALFFQSGTHFDLLSSRTGLLLCVFTAWLGITALTGVWWRGSLPPVESAVMSLALVFVIAGSLTTAERLKTALYVIGFCSLLAALQSYIFGEQGTGRLTLSAGSFMDPNAYAMTLVMGVPFLMFFARSSPSCLLETSRDCRRDRDSSDRSLYRFARRFNRDGRAICAPVSPAAMETRKILLLVIATVLLPSGYVLLPEYIKLRYLTLITNDVQTSDLRLREQVEGGDMEARRKVVWLCYRRVCA